ncbi:MAG TPA: tetratricopeptide repeat protein [Verrucomicrobiae bacterium]|nr:tetratricopeptide repeat protein [Verrucomicrobiae bacterium]
MSIESTSARRMIKPRTVRPKREFVGDVLPWVVTASGLVFYLLTLNHWVTLASLEHVTRVSGWSLDPALQGPLYWLVTLPLRLLPAKLIPLALNVLSAVCAALTLGLLARCVALLPQNRTEAQRIRQKSDQGLLRGRLAWLPPVFAVVICGLQLTFWENATAASAEMLYLLLFSYLVRCLMEYRVDGRDSWLWQGSLLYGVGMATNAAMICFFPVFLVALIWLRGLSFFNTRFLLRMFVLGVAGLSLYLLLPIVAAVSHKMDITFWQGLRESLRSQKQFVSFVFNKQVLLGNIPGLPPTWALALPSLLPVFAIALRWPAYFGDPSKLGVALTSLAFHFLHGVLLVFCVWVALDPSGFGPRNSLTGLPGLTLYFLGALSIGYLGGYFLLVFGSAPVGRPRPMPAWRPYVNQGVLACVTVVGIAAPVLLLARNLPQILFTNGATLRQCASLLTKNLPAKGAVVLADDEPWLELARADLAQKGLDHRYEFLNTGYLEYPAFYKPLKRAYPLCASLPKLPQPRSDEDKTRLRFALARFLMDLAPTNNLYYLHPSFGYYFEVFYPQARGMVYQLTRYPTNELLTPPLSPEQIAQNETFWDQAQPVLDSLASEASPPVSTFWRPVFQSLHLSPLTNGIATALALRNATMLNNWAVQLQRADHLPQAAKRFQAALRLNPDNVAAQINLACNRNLQAGKPAVVELSKSQEDQFGKYQSWDQVLGAFGQFDEQRCCLREGQAFYSQSNFRQAAVEFSRAEQLGPNLLQPRLLLAQCCLFAGFPDDTLKETTQIHQQAGTFDPSQADQALLLGVEMGAHLAKDDVSGAERTLDSALAQSPADTNLLANATRVFMSYGAFSNALPRLDTLLQGQPRNAGFLEWKGQACLALSNYPPAITAFTAALQTDTNQATRAQTVWLRANAYLGDGKLNLAQTDAQAVQHELPDQDVRERMAVSRFLGEVAYRNKDTNTAIRIYELYRTKLPTNAVEEISFVDTRLKELKRGSR